MSGDVATLVSVFVLVFVLVFPVAGLAAAVVGHRVAVHFHADDDRHAR
jgi:hypothetical protein